MQHSYFSPQPFNLRPTRRTSVDYPDGFAQYTATAGGELIIDSNLAPELVAERAAVLGAYVDWQSLPQEGAIMCGVAVVGTAWAIGTLNAPGAVFGIAGIACNCPQLITEKAFECP
jgi:hypothetical protein